MLQSFRFHSLQSRILVCFLALFAGVQITVLVTVTTANYRSTNAQVRNDLRVAGRVFQQFLQERVDQLKTDAQLLSGDFAFKQAFAGGDRATLLSAVANLQRRRRGADLMMVADAEDYSLSIDTTRPERHGQPFPFPELIRSAEDTGEPATALVEHQSRLYRLVLVPLLAPEPIAWISIGYRIDDALARSMQAMTLTDVSFLLWGGRHWRLAATSLPESLRDHFTAALATLPAVLTEAEVSLGAERYIALSSSDSETTGIMLTRSLDRALEPFERLFRLLLLLTVAGLAVAALVGMSIARTVTRPVRALAEGARRVGAGDYRQRISLDQRDELGHLAEAFNHMTRGLGAFQRYVPTDLVRTLISQGIETRPEARVATMLFTDIEGFTTLGERLSPQQLVEVLNDYFSVATQPIEKLGGVIIQYQGDAMLVVFNVPTEDPDHAANAVRAALEIQHTLERRTFSGGIRIRTRIGINTGEVVAASVGSAERVNFTVHGDAVNLAARLEALNKDYGTQILVSQETAARIGTAFRAEPVGEVHIRGKRRKVTVLKIPLRSCVASAVA